tara:strand:- start:112 stop:288 length:177 start_codon:yes stop_codon:yes gene_type:complete
MFEVGKKAVQEAKRSEREWEKCKSKRRRCARARGRRKEEEALSGGKVEERERGRERAS